MVIFGLLCDLILYMFVSSDETERNFLDLFLCVSKLCHTNDRSVGRLSFKFLCSFCSLLLFSCDLNEPQKETRVTNFMQENRLFCCVDSLFLLLFRHVCGISNDDL